MGSVPAEALQIIERSVLDSGFSNVSDGGHELSDSPDRISQTRL